MSWPRWRVRWAAEPGASGAALTMSEATGSGLERGAALGAAGTTAAGAVAAGAAATDRAGAGAKATASLSLWRATLTLLAGGALAQALPLLLGPWLARLFTPEQFGAYTTLWTVAANLAVVACLRYEFALPLERDEAGAGAVLALCLRLLGVMTVLAAIGAGVIALALPSAGTEASPDSAALWLALPMAVLALGACQLFTLWASRQQRFTTLAASRVLQHGGGALGQVAAGLAGASLWGLLAAPIVAAAAAVALLAKLPRQALHQVLRPASGALRAAASRHRDFPLFNAPHAFAGALQDTLAVLLLAAWSGDAAVGFWGLALRYLKAPATLVGGAVSQALYPKLVLADPAQARAMVRQVMALLAAVALPLAALLLLAGPALFALAFGERWRDAGELARALAPYIALHFIASPLAVVSMAWQAQAWALRLALVGQALFLLAMAAGLVWGGLIAAAWAVSAAMGAYFAWYFWKLATWPAVPHAAGA